IRKTSAEIRAAEVRAKSSVKGQRVGGPERKSIPVVVQRLDLLIFKYQWIFGMCLRVDKAPVQVESAYLIEHMGIKVMVVRRTIRIGPVDRIIVFALRVVEGKMRPIRRIHSPADIESIRVPMGRVIRQPRDPERSQA